MSHPRHPALPDLRRLLRPAMGWLLALVLGLGTLLVPVMRAEEAGLFRITLCAAELGATEVATDAQGRPLEGARHHCPDCTLAGLALLPAITAPPAFHPGRARPLAPFAAARATGHDLPALRARGPPILL